MTPWILSDGLAVLKPGWLLVGLALLIGAILFRTRVRGDGWQRIMSANVLSYLRGHEFGDSRAHAAAQHAANESPGAPGDTPLLRRSDRILLAGALIAVALAAPATRQSDAATWRHTNGWILVADVSRSMTLDDTVPSRLSALRDTALSLSRQAGARPLALILFAGDAFVVAPPAFDRRLIDEHIALLEYGTVPLDGSNLARALSLAADVAGGSRFVNARVLVLGDSGGTSRAAEAAARYLAADGHRVDMLIFGGDDGRLPADARASERLAREGGGTLLRSDAFGKLALDTLELNDAANPESTPGLQSLMWRNQSHWLLLGVLPLLLRYMRKSQV